MSQSQQQSSPKNAFSYRFRKWRIKLLNWEYWNFHVVYFPIYFYWAWLSIKARSFFFFSTSNPFIENGGFVMESKKAIYDIMPPEFYPSTIYISTQATHTQIQDLLTEKQLVFPLVAKPDIGGRGNAVKKLYSLNDLLEYHQHNTVNYLLQAWCPYENEIGLFYCKMPNSEQGFITGIVRKEFMEIMGDGIHTTEALLLQNDRFFLQHQTLLQTMNNTLQQIPAKGEKVLLVPYGNHCRGTKFVDDSHLITPELNAVFNQICSKIPGFYFGRMDIRFANWADLLEGKHFSIIELNGAGSEPTHIYDPSHSLWYAWKEIVRHLQLLFAISLQSKQQHQLQYLPFSDGIQLFKQKKLYEQQINLNV